MTFVRTILVFNSIDDEVSWRGSKAECQVGGRATLIRARGKWSMDSHPHAGANAVGPNRGHISRRKQCLLAALKGDSET